MTTQENSFNINLSSALDRKILMELFHSKRYMAPFEFLNGKRVMVISPLSISKFIDEELIHDNIEIFKQSGQLLHSMSSGERKQAFLQFCVTQNPDCIVLDHFYDNLDIQARSKFEHLLKDHINSISIINVYSRETDQLSFINKKLYFQAGELAETGSISDKRPTALNLTPIPSSSKHQDTDTNCLVKFKDVSISYLDKVILTNINWEINKGEFWHLHGPNGSGKTTLLTLITGDNPKAFNQNITLFGVKKGSGESVWDIKQKVGYFTSNMTFQFKRRQSMRDMIISGFYDSVGLYNKPTDHEIILGKEWLTFLNISELSEQPFIKMSLCHQRMIMIARAMVKHPPLLILDEPTVDLDHSSALLITDLINRIASQSDITIIYVSHRVEQGLIPSHSFELTPTTDKGSNGYTKKF